MTDLVDIYCPECDAEVHAHLRSQPATLSVRGEDVCYTETIAVCPTCGETIGDARVEGANLERAYAVYRAKHGIISPDEIRALRQSYRLPLREFSKFLGFGEQTAYRYEKGDIPDQAHNNTILSAKSLSGARLLLSQNRGKLSVRAIERIEQRIRDMADGAKEEARQRLTLEEREADSPSAGNGYRRLNLERVMALVFLLASKCKELYWTKLQKAVFFADMIFFERNSVSLTGLTYAHATFGPVIDRREDVRYLLSESGIVDFKGYGWGEILVPCKPLDLPFSDEELAFIDEIAEFVNTFSTVGDLSDFSHGLRCWDESVDGEIIEYTRDDGEVGRAMAERMRMLQGTSR